MQVLKVLCYSIVTTKINKNFEHESIKTTHYFDIACLLPPTAPTASCCDENVNNNYYWNF